MSVHPLDGLPANLRRRYLRELMYGPPWWRPVRWVRQRRVNQRWQQMYDRDPLATMVALTELHTKQELARLNGLLGIRPYKF